MIRKSLAKAFDPLYESPIRNVLPSPRLSTISDVSPPINDSASTTTSDELLHLNNSIDELGSFIQEIIDQALIRVVPETEENIINIETDVLLEIENDIIQDDINAIDDLLGINVTNESVNKVFDLEEEIFKLSNVIGSLDLTEGSNEEIESNNVIDVDRPIEIIDLKHEINITGLDVTSEYKSANTTLHEIEAELNVVEDIRIDEINESKIAQELNTTKEVATETEPIESPPSYKNKEFVEQNNLINRLTEEITKKDAELAKINDELTSQISDYDSLKRDCDNKSKEILELKLKLEEDKNLKENYTRLETEVQELKLRCKDYDNLQTNYKEKQIAYAELAAKYEDAVNKPSIPPVCNKAQDEELTALRMQFATKEKEFECILDNYSQLIEAQSVKYELVQKECSTAKQHLANLEIAFTDVHQKYERSKTVIEGYKANEEKLKSTLVMFETTLQKYNEELQTLKRKNLEENNMLKRELDAVKGDYATKIGKLQSKIKHLEIKATSLSNALEQKNKECQELTKLCEEMINVKLDDTSND